MVLYSWYTGREKQDRRRRHTFETPQPSREVLEKCLIHYRQKYGKPEVLGIREEDYREWMMLDIIHLKPPPGGFYLMSRVSLTLAQKVRMLIDSGRIKQVDDETCEVPSMSNPDKTYTVKWYGSGGTCECLGFAYRDWCSHIEAVKLIAPPQERKEEPILDEL